MSTATLTTKGQITIPAEVRKAMSVSQGDRVEFVEIEPGKFLLFAATRSMTELKGRFGKPDRPVSVEEMNEAIAQAASGE